MGQTQFLQRFKGSGTFFGSDVQHRIREFTPTNEPDADL